MKRIRGQRNTWSALENLEQRILLSDVKLHLAFISGPKATTADGTQTIVVAFKNSAGKIVTTEDADITLSLASSTGALVGTLTVSTIDGVATFSGIQETVAGKIKLIATDVADTNLSKTSNAFTVQAGEATQLVIVSEPTNGVPVTPLNPVVVDIEDAFGNIVTKGKTSVTATGTNSGDSSTTAPVTVKSKKGVATFGTLTLPAIGTYTIDLSATLPSEATVSATTGSISVVAAATRIVVMSSPAGNTYAAGTAISIVAALEDSSAVVTADNTPMTVSIASGPKGAKLTGVKTLTPTNGVATFSNLSLSKAGTYILLVSSGTRGTFIDTVTIVPGVAKKLQIASVAVGTATTLGTVVADVLDAHGNVVTDDSSTVTLTVYFGTIAATKTVTIGKTVGPTAAFTTTAAAVNGVATFSSLTTVLASGWYSVVVTDGSLTLAYRTVFVGNVGLG